MDFKMDYSEMLSQIEKDYAEFNKEHAGNNAEELDRDLAGNTEQTVAERDEKYKNDCKQGSFLRAMVSATASANNKDDLILRLDVTDLKRDVMHEVDLISDVMLPVNLTEEDRDACRRVKEYLGLVLMGMRQFRSELKGEGDGNGN